jgi:hypothetical protein
MSTTSEIVFQLNFMAGAADEGFGSKYSDAKIFRAAAARLSELERENARLREALVPFGDEWQYWKDDADIAEQGYLIVGDGDGTLSPVNISVAAFERAAALAGSGER